MKIFHILYLSIFLLGLTTVSCIRDEIPECPPMIVNIEVKDKNYFNVDKVELEQRKASDLPFREYIPTICWVLRDFETGTIVDRSEVYAIEGDEQIVQPDICPCIPHGKYILTVWGGLDTRDVLSEDHHDLTFHPENAPGNDVYMTNDTLVYDAWHNNFTVQMERTKGKLIVEKINFPQEVVRSEKTITSLYGAVRSNFVYSGQTHVNHLFDIADPAHAFSKTVLSPSLRKKGSVLKLNLLTASSGSDITPIRNPADVNLTMTRNELTVVRYVWDPDEGVFKIFILINDTWEQVNEMDIV